MRPEQIPAVMILGPLSNGCFLGPLSLEHEAAKFQSPDVGSWLRYGLLPLAIVVGAALAWLYTPDKRRAELETIYARPPSMFIEVAGIRLHVRDTGPKSRRP